MSKKITYKGVVYPSLTKFYLENEKTCDVSYATLRKNIKEGLPIEKAIKKNPRGLDAEVDEHYKDYILKNQFKKNTEIAKHLNLSRERVRQLRIKYDISKVRSPNPEIIKTVLLRIKNGESTIKDPLPFKIFKDLEVGKQTFLKWVDNEPKLKAQVTQLWEESVHDKTNYTEKICSDCKEIKALVDFYIDNKAHTLDGKARRCKQCTKDQVEHYYVKRNIQKPTVKFKICKKCNKNKEFFEYYRSTKSNSGLQSVCITCHDKQTVLSSV